MQQQLPPRGPHPGGQRGVCVSSAARPGGRHGLHPVQSALHGNILQVQGLLHRPPRPSFSLPVASVKLEGGWTQERPPTEATQLLQICTNYLVGLAMETKRKELPKSNVQEQIRLCEMAAYLTQGQHVDIL